MTTPSNYQIKLKIKLDPIGKKYIVQQPIAQQSIVQRPAEQVQTKSKYHNYFGLMGCLGGLFVELGVGSLYTWGIINIYVTSYYRLQDPTITLQQNAVAFPLMMLCQGLTMRLGLYFSQKTHPLITLLFNKTVSSAAVFAASYMPSIWGFIALFCIVFGLVQGMTIANPIVECNKYFPGYKMYINGFILTGVGLGSLVFGLVSYNFLNPDQVPTIAGYYSGNALLIAIAHKVPELVRWLSLIFIGTGYLGIAMMTPMCLYNRNKQNAVRTALLSSSNISNVNSVAIKVEDNNGYGGLNKANQAKSMKQAFCSVVCWIQVFIFIFGSTGLYMINGNFKTYVRKQINDDSFLTTAGVIGSLANGISRSIWGALFTKTGYRFVLCLNLCITIIVLSTIHLTIYNKAGFIIELFLANFCVGGYLVFSPTYGQIVFGQEVGSNMYGFYWCVLATANFIQFIFVQQLADKIGFDNVFYICLGMVVCVIPVMLFFPFQGPWKNPTIELGFIKSWEIEKQQKLKLKQRQNLSYTQDLIVSLPQISNNQTQKIHQV